MICTEAEGVSGIKVGGGAWPGRAKLPIINKWHVSLFWFGGGLMPRFTATLPDSVTALGLRCEGLEQGHFFSQSSPLSIIVSLMSFITTSVTSVNFVGEDEKNDKR